MKKRNLLWLALALFGAACTMDTPDFETQDTPKEGNPYFVSVEEAIEKADQFFALLDTTPGTRTQ
ncbi:MAG: hypothetical protein HDR88_06515 [Bacteroides sp.]|nr:hypothetical protein [Bacteroides sp.]